MTYPSRRILSLDVFRGLTMVLMILVNGQGTRSIYPILEHATWNGCTLADIVFPSFLFIVGVTIAVSLRQYVAHDFHLRKGLHWNIFKRSILLFAIGLFLNAFPLHVYWDHLRLFGILQRIALCYLVCALLYLHTSVRTQALIFLLILAVFGLLYLAIPLPYGSANTLSMDANWPRYIDGYLLTPQHMYKAQYDPEGVLTTIPALATTLSGLMVGQLILCAIPVIRQVQILLISSALMLLSGWLWSFVLPLNKNLWTSSFVLWTSGVATGVFALCYYLIDVRKNIWWTRPFQIFGVNALFIFIVHVVLLKLQSLFELPLRDGRMENMRVAIADYLFGFTTPECAGLGYAVLFLMLNFLVAWYLYKKKIFIKL